ncbi:MAG TPA: RNA polymerase sigma factor, partial [Armatimonadota bacterium]|nr:RNA polymerase sigma factor [Armatimonadota bacterium]
PISVDGGEIEREVADWSTNPERTLEKKDLQAAVQGALDTLSDEHRAVVVLHHIEGMDLKDIAQELGIPEGTVKSRLARARDELKRKLGHYVA